jgi:hypothetical protein
MDFDEDVKRNVEKKEGNIWEVAFYRPNFFPA